MSRRSSIAKAFATLLADNLTGSTTYTTNINGNAYSELKFWDEVNDFPSIYIGKGSETREYMPAGFAWGFLNLSIKLYCKSESSTEELEVLLEDVERLIDSQNGFIIYDSTKGYSTTELSIISIVTDEGLLKPYAVGEISLLVRYEIPKI